MRSTSAFLVDDSDQRTTKFGDTPVIAMLMHRIGDSEPEVDQDIGCDEPVSDRWSVGIVICRQVPEGTLKQERLTEVERAETYSRQNDR
jgi:hypothetical protein